MEEGILVIKVLQLFSARVLCVTILLKLKLEARIALFRMDHRILLLKFSAPQKRSSIVEMAEMV